MVAGTEINRGHGNCPVELFDLAVMCICLAPFHSLLVFLHFLSGSTRYGRRDLVAGEKKLS